MHLRSSGSVHHCVHREYGAAASARAPINCVPSSLSASLLLFAKDKDCSVRRSLTRRRNIVHGTKRCRIVASGNLAAPFWDAWKPETGSASPSLSDVLWPSAGK